MACGKSLEDGQNWPSRRQEKGQRESANRQKGLYMLWRTSRDTGEDSRRLVSALQYSCSLLNAAAR